MKELSYNEDHSTTINLSLLTGWLFFLIDKVFQVISPNYVYKLIMIKLQLHLMHTIYSIARIALVAIVGSTVAYYSPNHHNRRIPAPSPTMTASPTATPSPTPTASPTPSPSPTPVAGTKKVWGAFTEDVNSLASFESLTGKPVNIYAEFDSISDPFPDVSSSIGSKGKTLLIYWESDFGYDQINDGSNDSNIKLFAAGAKTYGYPVILVPFAEMNINEEAWGYTINGNTPAKFLGAWKHIHDLFVQAGATNVKFGWAPNSDSVPDTPENSIQSYYPGSSYVDYVGVDGFNFGSPWQSFDQIFDNALAVLKGYNKPVYIFSMASAAGTSKASWINDTLITQMNKHPEIAGWIWFNENKEQDWRINSDSSSLSSFKAAISK